MFVAVLIEINRDLKIKTSSNFVFKSFVFSSDVYIIRVNKLKRPLLYYC